MTITNVFCGPKQSRRYLILVNIVTGIVGFILLGIGSYSLETGSRMKEEVLNVFCEEACVSSDCSKAACSPAYCDCAPASPVSTISTEYFTAPAAGMAAVGFLSMLASIVGCMAAVRAHPVYLLLYILALIILIILQFSFAIAGAVLGNVPDVMSNFLSANYYKMNWGYLQAVLPEGCWASKTYDNFGENAHPACNWDGTCNPDFVEGMMTEYSLSCCAANNQCNLDQPLCQTPYTCMFSLMKDIGVPIGVAGLLTIFLQFLAIWWAWTVRKETKAGGIFDHGRVTI